MSQSPPGLQPVLRRSAPSEAALALRLVAVSGGIGIELSQAVELGPVRVEELSWALPGLRLPTDLSGGVRAFRHRRGSLQRLALSIDLRLLEPWLKRRARTLWPSNSVTLRLWALGEGLGIGLHTAQAALAFDLLWVPTGDDARCVIAEPRVAGEFRGPPVVHAFRFCDAVFGELYQRSGRLCSFGPLARTITRALLPSSGVRLPSLLNLDLGQLAFRDERVWVDLERARGAFLLAERAVRAVEFAKLVLAADKALDAGDSEQARNLYLGALEQAPRHPELCHSVAAIDKDFGERREAALGLLVESLPAVEFGLVGAELLGRTGDMGGAKLAIAKQAGAERFAPLAALLWVHLATLADNVQERSEYLEQALGYSPSCYAARWERFVLRVSVGDVNGALADAEHLEAAQTGSAARHEVILNAARQLQDAGFAQPAGRLFERALRYLPKDARANLGLAESLLQGRKPERAFALLERAVELADSDGEVEGRAGVLLAQLLAEHYRDLPQAIARARAVPGTTFVAAQARALEAKWREALGDLAGAELAYARMRDTLDLARDVQPGPAVIWLKEAAQLNVHRGERRAAERHLACALRLEPRDLALQHAYRKLSLELNGVRAEDMAPAAAPPASPVVNAPPRRMAPEPLTSLLGDDEVDDVELERRVEQLKAELNVQTTPSPGLLTELSAGLSRLGRNAELYALLQARFEDADDTTRALLQPELVRTLQQLVNETEVSSPEEAAVYQLMLARLQDA